MMRSLIFMAVAVFATGAFGSSPQDAKFVEDGCCGYTLVTPDNMSEVDAYVAKDMNELLARALGGDLKTATASAAPASRRLFFGISPKGFDTASLENQERCTVVEDGDIYVFGGGTNGNRYAAYDFLQNTLGYRFFDARGGVGVPDLSQLRLTNMVRRTKFTFKFRSFGVSGYFNGREVGKFFFRNGFNGDFAKQVMVRDGLPETICCDFYKPWPVDCASECYLPRSPRERRQVTGAGKICGELAKEHPEYFTMTKDGKRDVNEQRCWSNRGLRDLLWKVVDQYFAQRKHPSINDISAVDRGGRFCWCPDCIALEEKYGTPGGPILDAILEISEKCRTAHPEQFVSLLAYRKPQTQKPPTKVVTRLPDNFVPVFAPINDNFFQSFEHPSNTNSYNHLKGWCKLSDNVMVWHYVNPYMLNPTPPLGNVGRICTDVKLMKEAGVMGTCFEHNCGVSEKTGFTELQTYAMLRLFDDVTIDQKTLVREFTDFEYGPAAEGVRRYLDELETLTQKFGGWAVWNPPFSDYGYLTPENLIRWAHDFEAMAKLVAGDKVREQNLQRLRYNVDHALLQMYPRIKYENRKGLVAYEAIERRIRDEAKSIEDVCFSADFAQERKKFADALEKKLFMASIMCSGASKPLPQDVFGGIPQNHLYVTLPRGGGSKLVEDADAAFGKATYFDGKNDAKSLALPFVMKRDSKPGGHNPNLATVEKLAPGSRGKYAFYFVGQDVVRRSYTLQVLSYHAFRAELGNAYTEGEHNRCKFYASLKFQGPAFYPEDAGKPNAVWCDRIVVVRDWDGK